MRVRIVGADDGKHLRELKKLADDLGVADRFEWVGPKYGDDLSAEYDNCDVFVLPSFTENFGGVVVDALAHGKPVIASKFTPWREVEGENGERGVKSEGRTPRGAMSKDMNSAPIRNLTPQLAKRMAHYVGDVNRTSTSTSTSGSSRCGWWVDNDPETLAKTLLEAMSLSDEERRQMGEVGRKLVEAKYTWSAVAKKMGECYESLKV